MIFNLHLNLILVLSLSNVRFFDVKQVDVIDTNMTVKTLAVLSLSWSSWLFTLNSQKNSIKARQIERPYATCSIYFIILSSVSFLDSIFRETEYLIRSCLASISSFHNKIISICWNAIHLRHKHVKMISIPLSTWEIFFISTHTRFVKTLYAFTIRSLWN